MEVFVTYGDINRPFWIEISKQICYALFNIWTTMSTRFKTEKSCKGGVNHTITKCTSAYSGSPYMMSRDQLYYVMTSSDSHGETLYLVVDICLLKTLHHLFIHDKLIFRYIISFRTFWSTHVCVSSDMPNNIRVGSSGKSLFIFFIYIFKKWLPDCFFNRFCFFDIQLQ